MASLSAGYGGNCAMYRLSSDLVGLPNRNVRSCSQAVSCKPRESKISMSQVKLDIFPKQKQVKERNYSHERIDDWMRDSVVEIVKKLPESPLLIQVFDEDTGDRRNNARRLWAEKADEDEWVTVRERWNKGENPMPDGVIFVEQIEAQEAEDGIGAKNEDVSRAWGIVVQGRGEGCAPACYLLKTSRAGSGLGASCTHFCLVKVKSFRETALSQLKNCWLLQGN